MSKRKQKKSSLKPLLSLLLLTAVILVASTYAWFTSNKLVKINSLDVEIQASQGFQISLDGINWKSVLSSSDIMSNILSTTYPKNNNHVPTELMPVSTAATIVSDAEATANPDLTQGYLNMFDGAVDVDTTGNYTFASTQIAEDNTTGKFIAFDLFFKTNNPIDLQLDPSAKVTDNAVTAGEPTKAGKGMENAARVAFVQQGFVAGDNPAASVTQPLKYDGGSTGDLWDGSGNVTIWEPNDLSHTILAQTETYNLWGIQTTDTLWNSRIVYDGVYAETLVPILLTQTTATASPDYFSKIKAAFVGTVAGNSNTTSLGITLGAGVTKMRVYMWLEGQDYDCGDSASGSYVRYDLALSAIPSDSNP